MPLNEHVNAALNLAGIPLAGDSGPTEHVDLILAKAQVMAIAGLAATIQEVGTLLLGRLDSIENAISNK